MDTVNLNLAHRWFIGYDLDESITDHSSLSKIRERFGLEVFQQFFEQIVELCIEAGLVWGEELYFDSTKVQANASINNMIDRTEFEAYQRIDQLFEHSEDDPSGFGKMVTKYNGKRLHGIRKPHYHRITDEQVSPIDPDSAVSRRKSEQVLLYKSKAEVCNACPLKSKCTGRKSGRY